MKRIFLMLLVLITSGMLMVPATSQVTSSGSVSSGGVGPKGDTGPQGAQGAQGPAGADGEAGAAGATGASGLAHQQWMNNRPFSTGAMTGTETLTDALAYAVCVGVLQKAATAFSVRFTTTTATTGTGAAEIAIATGTPVVDNGNPTLTVKGYADATTPLQAVAGAQSFSVTATVAAGNYIWVVFYQNQNGTAGALRSGATADTLTMGWSATVAATQPSTIVNTPTVFTGSATDIPYIAVLPS